MELILWFFIIIPVILAGGAMHWKKSKDKDIFWKLLPKCLVTWVIACIAALGAFCYGNDSESILVLLAIFLFMIADAALEIRFLIGVGCFGTGHILLICWMIKNCRFHLGIIILLILGVLLSIMLFQRELKNKRMIYLLLVYTIILSAMMAVAVFLPVTQGKSFLLTGIGGVGFWISDMFVGKGIFGKLTPKQELFALYLYYFSVLCFALTTWMI